MRDESGVNVLAVHAVYARAIEDMADAADERAAVFCARLQVTAAQQSSTLGLGLARSSTRLIGDGHVSKYGLPILDPESSFIVAWVRLSIFALIYDMIMIPFETLLFEVDTLLPGMDVAMASFWTLDFCITLLKGHHEGTHLLRDCRSYWRSWGAFDLFLVVLEWVVFFMNGAQASTPVMLRAGQLLRFLRLLRLLTANRRSKTVLSENTTALLRHRFGTYMLVVLGTLQVIACTWVRVGHLNAGRGPSWVTSIMEADGTASPWYLWLAAFHWAVCQLHGAMEIHAHNNYERIFVLGIGVTACIFYPLAISSVTASVVRWQELHREFAEKGVLMSELLTSYKVPYHLQKRAATHIKHLALQQHRDQTNDLVHSLPDTLQGELCQAIRYPFICHHNLHRYLNGGFPMLSKRLCQRAMSHTAVREHERIFSSGQLRTAMAFVEWGQVHYTLSDSLRSSSLRMRTAFHRKFKSSVVRGTGDVSLVEIGHWLSEGALFVRWHATGDACASCDTSLILVEAAAFGAETSHFRAALRDVALYAHHFSRCAVEHLGTCDCTDLAINLSVRDINVCKV